jgi:hypothetical protein
MINYRDTMGFACSNDGDRHEGGRPRSYPASPPIPRRGTIWIPSTLIVPDKPLNLPSQDRAVDLDRTMV